MCAQPCRRTGLVLLSIVILLAGPARALTLVSEQLRVVLDDRHPIIESIRHRATGVQVNGPGAQAVPPIVHLPGESIPLDRCKISITAGEDSTNYRVAAGETVQFTLRFELRGDHLWIAVTDIAGPLQGIDFSPQPLVSVANDGPWQLGVTWNMMNGGRIEEAFASSAADPQHADWAVLANGQVAVTIQNTIPIAPHRVHRAADRAGLGSGAWTYALRDGYTAPAYECVVGLVGDRNGDGTADWQDGCLFLQNHLPGPIRQLPELIHHQLLGWIGVESALDGGMNATFPQIADIIRRTYNITAGEAMAVGLAGWCYWGWDSEYPAVEEASRRAGGNPGLVQLCQEAWRYGSQVSLCINFDDAYEHSPAWDTSILSTNDDGTLRRDLRWHGGLRGQISPFLDVTRGSAFERFQIMRDFGTAGSCYIDVLSSPGSLRKSSSGPGRKISVLENLVVGRYAIAEHYWNNGIKLYSESSTYPYVGHILGGMNNDETGLDGEDLSKIPMPAFILHGRFNHFFSATRYDRNGRLLLGIVPTVGGHVGTPGREELDRIFLHALPARTFVDQPMRSFRVDEHTFHVTYADGTQARLDRDGQNLTVLLRGRKLTDDDSAFTPRPDGSYWAYCTQTRPIRYPLPEGWTASGLRVFALNREGRHEQVIGAAEVDGQDLVLQMFARVPYLVRHEQDLVPVGSADYGRHARHLLTHRTAAAEPDQAPLPATDAVASVQTPEGTWLAFRRHATFAPYHDKFVRPKDRLVLLDADGKAQREVAVLGPVTDMLYDAARNQIIVATGAFNYDGVQMVDPLAGRVVGLVPLVPELWGRDLMLALDAQRDILYVASASTRNVAAIALDVPWPAQAADWSARVFEQPSDARDPEAALDAFLEVRWDRLRAVHELGIAPSRISAAPEGGVVLHEEDLAVAIVPVDGPWMPEAQNGRFPPPLPILDRASSLPRERVIGTSLPGHAEPWWLTLPREKHHIISEPAPPGIKLLPCVSPRYPTIEAAKEHACLIAALRVRGLMRDWSTMPLVRLGETIGVPRKYLRKGHDYWMMAYMHAEKNVGPDWIAQLPGNTWYVETLALPDGSTRYRAGLLVQLPLDRVEALYHDALERNRQWYLAALPDVEDPERRRAYEKIVQLLEQAPQQAPLSY